ncbi:alpha/beta fold hydrolase [Comamonas faecalis]|uniref:Alpha/beta fold hydrolase n=1 Tax=Comamonas faecalis TaxID=1387849 RepID=A0ABP7QK12_9BURK
MVQAGGTQLALQVHESTGDARASVVLGCAIGVPQRYYQDFAAWLARQGFRVTTFDYRGHGASLQGPARRVRANLLDWARDYEAVVAQARAQLPGRPLFLLGHSLGAQLPGLFQRPGQVDGLLAVAAGSGYWREIAPQARRRAHLLWYGVLPASTLACGYFPGRRLGVIGDLPAGVAWQWRRWCLSPRYSVGAEGEAVARSYAAVRYPIHALSFADDEMMTLRGTQSLLALYAGAPRQIERIDAQAVQGARIGHMGFFRSAFEASLWPRAAAVLQRWCADA